MHARTHARTHTHTHTHARTHARTHANTHKQANTNTQHNTTHTTHGCLHTHVGQFDTIADWPESVEILKNLKQKIFSKFLKWRVTILIKFGGH